MTDYSMFTITIAWYCILYNMLIMPSIMPVLHDLKYIYTSQNLRQLLLSKHADKSMTALEILLCYCVHPGYGCPPLYGVWIDDGTIYAIVLVTGVRPVNWVEWARTLTNLPSELPDEIRRNLVKTGTSLSPG